MVLVNLSGDATSLREWTARLDRRWAEFDIADMAPGWSMTFDIGANWKLVVENFLESYHLPVVHPGLNAYSPLEDHDLVVDEVFMGQLSLNYAPRDGGNALPRFAGLSGARATSGEYLLLFPSLMVSITPPTTSAPRSWTPVSTDRSHQRWGVFLRRPGERRRAVSGGTRSGRPPRGRLHERGRRHPGEAAVRPPVERLRRRAVLALPRDHDAPVPDADRPLRYTGRRPRPAQPLLRTSHR